VRFEWSYWKQCRVPFSPKTLDYIRRLDAMHDAEELRALGIRDDEILGMVLSTLVLQYAALERHLTLAEIAQLVQRPRENITSVLEQIVATILDRLKTDGKDSSRTDKDATSNPIASPSSSDPIDALVHISSSPSSDVNLARALRITRAAIAQHVDAAHPSAG
jgi:hypothetical protein